MIGSCIPAFVLNELLQLQYRDQFKDQFEELDESSSVLALWWLVFSPTLASAICSGGTNNVNLFSGQCF